MTRDETRPNTYITDIVLSPNSEVVPLLGPRPNISDSCLRQSYLAFTEGSRYSDVDEIPFRFSLSITIAPQSFYVLLFSNHEGTCLKRFSYMP